MSGWFAADADAWEEDLEDRPRPLKASTVRIDLRHLENQARAGGRFPGRNELCKRWGWGDRAVRNALARNDWHDPVRPIDTDSLIAARRPPYQRPSGGPRGAQEEVQDTPKPTTDQPTESFDLGPSHAQEAPKQRPSGGPHARSISEPENQEPGTNQLQRARDDQLSEAVRPRTLLSTVWEALMRLYVESGHGKKPLDLDSSGRRPALEKCLRALHRDPLAASKMMVKVLGFWLYGPNDWHRQNLEGSALIAALLTHTKIGNNATKAESWDWDGEVRERAGPTALPGKQSNASREIARLMKVAEQLDEEDRINGISQDHHEGDPPPPGLWLLQPASRR